MILHKVSDLVARGVIRVEDGNHGNDRPRPDEFVPTGVAFIRAADMTRGVVDFIGAGKINQVARSRIRKGIGSSGDVILSHKGTVGRIAVAPLNSPEFVCSPQTTFWRSLDAGQLDQRFLRYAMATAHFAGQLDVLKGQTDMAPYVSLTDQRSLLIHVPEVGEQRAIAEVLGALDDKIAANDRMLRVLDGLGAAEVRRATRIRESTPTRLRDVVRLHYGKALPASARCHGTVEVYGSGGVTGFHDSALVDGQGIVVGRKGTVGAVYWADGPHFPIDTTYFVEPLVFSAEVTYYLLRSLGLDRLNSDSAVPGLNRDEAYAQMLHIPLSEDAMLIERDLKRLFALAKSIRAQTRVIQSARDTLLPLLMSGKVFVNDSLELVAPEVPDAL